jgi:PAS domain S-box-containing protein
VAISFTPAQQPGGRVLLLGGLAGLAWLAGYAVATALVGEDGLGGKIVGDVVFVLPVAVAAVLTAIAAVLLGGERRRFWVLLALANGCWLLGELTWSVLELGFGREVPFPSIADVFYLGMYPFAIAAVVYGLRGWRRVPIWRAVADASIMVAALGFVWYTLLFEPQLAEGASLATVTGIAYPLLDLAILMLLVTVAAAHRGAPRSITLVAYGFAVAAATDAGYWYLTSEHAYLPGSWLNLGWQVQAVLFALAAALAIRSPEHEEEAVPVKPSTRDVGLPVVLGGVAISILLLSVQLVDGRLGVGGALLGVYTIAAVVFRLQLTSGQHRETAKSLARNLEKREIAEQELASALSIARATLESTADGILVVDRAGKVIGANRKFQEMWRIPDDVIETRKDEEILSVVLDQLVDPDGFLAKVRELYADPDSESFDTLHFRDGRIFERYSTPQKVSGVSVGRVWSFRDVTERHQLEEQLRQVQRMEAVGRLAGGVAHDFNNLLTVIAGYSELLIRKLDDNDAALADASEIAKSSQRAASLTRQLLAFSRRQMLQPKVVDLNSVVGEMKDLLRPLIGEDITVVSLLAPNLWPTRVDRGQIEQVIVNLALNAREAMPDGGTLTIETANVTGSATEVGRVRLTVRDTGRGMDAETKAQAFEPFFTTKPPGQGHGLGLSTVFGIVQQSGGTISVESEPGEGAVFRVELPRVAAPAGAESSNGRGEAAPGGTETVLLVEDEEVVRNLVREILTEQGYDVLAAMDGDEALQVAAEHAGPIHVLLTDVVMPGMSGRELAGQLAPMRPETKILYMSGYTEDAVVRRGVHESETEFLQKPFTIEQLARRLRVVLESRQAA